MFSDLKGEGRALLANVPQVAGNQVLSGNKTATAFAAEHLTCTKTDTRSLFGSEKVIKRGGHDIKRGTLYKKGGLDTPQNMCSISPAVSENNIFEQI